MRWVILARMCVDTNPKHQQITVKCLAIDKTVKGADLAADTANTGARHEVSVLQLVGATQCNHTNTTSGRDRTLW
jgi:hypothetical protein